MYQSVNRRGSAADQGSRSLEKRCSTCRQRSRQRIRHQRRRISYSCHFRDCRPKALWGSSLSTASYRIFTLCDPLLDGIISLPDLKHGSSFSLKRTGLVVGKLHFIVERARADVVITFSNSVNRMERAAPADIVIVRPQCLLWDTRA